MAGRADRARPAHERWCITVIRFPFTTNFRCMAATVQTLYSENRLLTPAKSGSRKHGAPPISQQPEPSERLLDRCDLSGGHGFSLGAIPGSTKQNCSLQSKIHALSGTKPCWRETHFWISWSLTRSGGCPVCRDGCSFGGLFFEWPFSTSLEVSMRQSDETPIVAASRNRLRETGKRQTNEGKAPSRIVVSVLRLKRRVTISHGVTVSTCDN